MYPSKLILALVARYSASGSCEPINCCHINSYNFFQTSEHFEHVTSYFYQMTKNETRSFFFKSHNDFKNLKLSVDTQSDFDRISNIIRLMKKKHVTYDLKKISELVENLS